MQSPARLSGLATDCDKRSDVRVPADTRDRRTPDVHAARYAWLSIETLSVQVCERAERGKCSVGNAADPIAVQAPARCSSERLGDAQGPAAPRESRETRTEPGLSQSKGKIGQASTHTHTTHTHTHTHTHTTHAHTHTHTHTHTHKRVRNELMCSVQQFECRQPSESAACDGGDVVAIQGPEDR